MSYESITQPCSLRSNSDIKITTKAWHKESNHKGNPFSKSLHRAVSSNPQPKCTWESLWCICWCLSLFGILIYHKHSQFSPRLPSSSLPLHWYISAHRSLQLKFLAYRGWSRSRRRRWVGGVTLLTSKSKVWLIRKDCQATVSAYSVSMHDSKLLSMFQYFCFTLFMTSLTARIQNKKKHVPLLIWKDTGLSIGLCCHCL